MPLIRQYPNNNNNNGVQPIIQIKDRIPINDTLSACLDANGTYICTPFSPRCYVIQKVNSNAQQQSLIPSCQQIQQIQHPKYNNTAPCPYNLFQQTQQQRQIQHFQQQRAIGPSAPKTNVSNHQHSIGFNPNQVYMNGEINNPSDPLSMGFVPSSSLSLAGNGNACGMTNRTTQLTTGVAGMTLGSGKNEDSIVTAMDDTTPTTTTPTPTDERNDLSPDELRQLITAQLEYYFSPENLSNDKFLVSQMDSDQYVYISTVSNFNMIKKLSSDLDLITQVLKESKLVQVHPDGKRVRPISNRTVVILRGIPESTPIQEIKGLFDKPNAPHCNNCEFAFNDSWYLSFDSDDEAVRAHRYLREDVREFKGHPIMARIKSRPTTLLSQGVIPSNLKNGYHSSPQHATGFSTFSGHNTSGVVTATAPPIYQQQVQPTTAAVFTTTPIVGPYGNFTTTTLPWGGYYDLSPTMGMYSINGLHHGGHLAQQQSLPQQQQHHQQQNYKPPLPIRHRNPSLPRGGSHNASHSSSLTSNRRPQQSSELNNGNYVRKSTPTPLLGIAPSILPQPQQQQRNGGYTNMEYHSRSYPRESSSGSSTPREHKPSESAHHSQQQQQQQQRPPPPQRSNTQANVPLKKTTPTSSKQQQHQQKEEDEKIPPSKPIAQAVTSSHATTTTTNTMNKFDLESNSFPPLPGASAVEGGAFVGAETVGFEGRLSDVVKGVKPIKLDKEPESNSAVAESSQSAVTKDIPSPCNKKEFREVGVGSVDDSGVVASEGSRPPPTTTTTTTTPTTTAALPPPTPTPTEKQLQQTRRETADKSTRTDTAFLSSDIQPITNAPRRRSPKSATQDNKRRQQPMSDKDFPAFKSNSGGSVSGSSVSASVSVSGSVSGSAAASVPKSISCSVSVDSVVGDMVREPPQQIPDDKRTKPDDICSTTADDGNATHTVRLSYAQVAQQQQQQQQTTKLNQDEGKASKDNLTKSGQSVSLQQQQQQPNKHHHNHHQRNNESDAGQQKYGAPRRGTSNPPFRPRVEHSPRPKYRNHPANSK